MLLAALLTGTLSVLFIVVSLLMMLVILVQRPKGGGLSGAFGGAGGSAQAAFGAKTGDFLTWTTVVFFVLFLSLAMGLTWSIRADVARAQEARQRPGVSTPGDAAGAGLGGTTAPTPADTPDVDTHEPTVGEAVEEVIDRQSSADEAQQILDNAEEASPDVTPEMPTEPVTP